MAADWKDERPIQGSRSRAIANALAGNFAVAAAEMERLARTKPLDASLWSDAAAFRLEQAARSGDKRFALEGLALADHAIAIDADHDEAHFNRALALESLGLRRPAVASYLRALVSTHSDGWATETRTRIAALKIPTAAANWPDAKTRLLVGVASNDLRTVHNVVVAFPQKTRTWAEGECLVLWATDVSRGEQKESKRLLDAARAVGAALREISGEALLADTVAALDRTAKNEHKRTELLEGFVAYERGRIAFNDRDNRDAVTKLETAVRLFATTLPPMALTARYFAASARFDSGVVTNTLADLRRLQHDVPRQYVALQAQINWEIGTVLARRGNLEEALREYQSAAAKFENLHEHQFAARMRTLCGRTLTLMGQPAEAWRLRTDSLAVASESGDDALLEFTLGETALDEVFERRWATARALLDVSVRSVPSSNPRRRFDILLWRALTTSSPDLDAPAKALNSIRDPNLRSEAENDLNFALARNIRDRDPRKAIALLSSCVRYAQTNRTAEVMLPHIFLERARAYRSAHNYEQASRDANAAVTLFERRRVSITSRGLRDAFFGTADEAFQELMTIKWLQGDARATFAVSERHRGRIFLDAIGDETDTARPMDAEEVTRRSPVHTAFLILTTCGDRAILTFIARDTFEAHEIREPVSTLSARVATLRNVLEHPGSSLTILDELFELVVAPVAEHLHGVSTLVIVADDPFQSIPFALLHDRQHNRYLIEEVAVVRAPSASTFVQAIREPALGARRSVVVSVGDPSFSRMLFPDLERLPDSRVEAREVAASYNRVLLLTDREATYRNLARSIGQADVIHIGTHGIVNANDASSSELLLAEDGEDSGACSLSRLAALQVRKGALVVLAGCRTAIRGSGHGELRELGAPFLAAGASSVVSTLSNVDDRAMHRFAVAFHRTIRGGRPPVEALRDVQLGMLRSVRREDRDPRAWGSVEIYGTGQ